MEREHVGMGRRGDPAPQIKSRFQGGEEGGRPENLDLGYSGGLIPGGEGRELRKRQELMKNKGPSVLV